MTIQFYTLPSAPPAFAAHDTESATWSTFHAVPGGYQRRREWQPGADLAEHLTTARDKHGRLIHRCSTLTGTTRRWLGIT